MDTKPLGYHYKMRQASTRQQFSLPYVEKFTNSDIEKFLLDGFDLKVENCVYGQVRGVSDEYLTFLCQLSSLSMDLLQAAKVPCFDGIFFRRVVRSKRASHVQIEIQFPMVEYVSKGIIGLTFRTAFSCLQEILKNGNTPDTREQVFEYIENKYIKLLKRHVAGGRSTIPMLRAAYNMGISFSHLGIGIYQLGMGSSAMTIDRSITQKDTVFSLRLSKNKLHTARLLKAAGLPTPQHIRVTDDGTLVEAAAEIGFPVVVKPADMDRGEGITVEIFSEADLKKAYEKAKAVSGNILVEKHIPGVCHRITMVDGCIGHIYRRDPRAISGDGVSTISEIMELENRKELLKPKYKRQPLFILDDIAKRAIERNGYLPDQIVAEGEAVPVRDRQSSEFGGETVNCIDTIHPENIALAKQAADILHMSTAGVDLISTDITVPWYDNGAAINEMNFSPSWRDHKELLREGRIKFLEKTFPTQGRIPVHVFVGDEAAKQAAQTHHAARIDAGQRAYLVCGDRVYGPAGLKPLSFQEVSVFLRTKALCLHSDVDELILSVHSTEFLTTGLPVDRISSLTVTNHSLSMHLAPGRAATQNEIASLIKALEKTLLEEK